MKPLLGALTVALALMLSACQTTPWKKSSQPPAVYEDPAAGRVSEGPVIAEQGLRLSAQQRFPDVPLPHGVKEDSERTFVYESSTLKLGNLVYTSKAAASELAQFYIRECPTAGWQLESVVQADVIKLEFRKPDKRLRVTISELGLARGRMLALLLVPDSGP